MGTTEEERAAIDRVKAAMATLNKELGAVARLGIAASIDAHEQQVIGVRSPILRLSARLIRSRVEIDERV